MKVKRRIKLLNQPNKIVHNFRRHRCRVGPPIWDPEAVANYPILTLATRGASTHLKSHSNVLRPVHKIQGLSSTLWARNADLKFKFVLEKKKDYPAVTPGLVGDHAYFIGLLEKKKKLLSWKTMKEKGSINSNFPTFHRTN